MIKLTNEEITNKLPTINNWKQIENSLQKKFQFKGFEETMTIINKIAKIANELNHHPEWFNVYNKLEITLTTHDVNGISELDFDFAKKVDAITNDL